MSYDFSEKETGVKVSPNRAIVFYILYTTFSIINIFKALQFTIIRRKFLKKLKILTQKDTKQNNKMK